MKLNILMTCALAGLLAACAADNNETAPPAAEPETPAAVSDEASPAPETKTEADYSDEANWLCHPDKAGKDTCAVDLETTIVRAGNGQPLTETVSFTPAADPGFDCFYLYPTVSTDQTGNSDLVADAAELNVVKVQFARFGEACRLYAPMYRQVTLKGLRDRMTGVTGSFDESMAFADASAAWNHYLEHENDGRGVILIGHSQGSRMIDHLLKNDILGKPAQDKLISAMPIGYSFLVDRKTQTFEGMPLCETKDQTGCLISYVSFRNDSPPPATSLFGKSTEEGKQAACVNPQKLTGRDALTPYLSNVPDAGGNEPDFAGDAADVTTPFATLPGLISAECVESGAHTYLAITTNADPDDPRTDRIAGDVYFGPMIAKDWGLHLGDMHLTKGDLIEIAKAQGASWEAQQAE